MHFKCATIQSPNDMQNLAMAQGERENRIKRSLFKCCVFSLINKVSVYLKIWLMEL